MYIIYRVYKKGENYYNNEIIAQDVIEVKEKDDFKNAIKLIYGDDIKFKNTKNVKEGDLFISIISYDCNNPEDYLNTMKCTCDYYKKEFITRQIKMKKFHSYELDRLFKLNPELFEKYKFELESNIFCSSNCLTYSYCKYEKLFYDDYVEKNGFINTWVNRESSFKDSGYIYMITKKSTQEFYVGKTNALPMFRWVQHLKTDRFSEENIVDYKFEILEVCREKMTERETFWINKKYLENKEKCLNKIIPHEEKITIKDEKIILKDDLELSVFE